MNDDTLTPEEQPSKTAPPEPDLAPTFSDMVDHNIRLFAFSDGLLIIGIVQGLHDGAVNVRFPFEVHLESVSEETMTDFNAYNLIPFLDALSPFDINSPAGINLNVSQLITCTVPAPHLVRNYRAHLYWRKQHQDGIDGVSPKETMH